MRNEDNLWFSITKKDIEINWFSGKGAGGQHRNKHQNCVRLTHKPTNITAVGQSHRERRSNLRDALEILASRVVSYYLMLDNNEKMISDERIRTYHEPRNTVIDHASGKTQSYKNVVVNGNIGDMIEARLEAMAEEFMMENKDD